MRAHRKKMPWATIVHSRIKEKLKEKTTKI
jgi:hypothetical protein